MDNELKSETKYIVKYISQDPAFKGMEVYDKFSDLGLAKNIKCTLELSDYKNVHLYKKETIITEID